MKKQDILELLRQKQITYKITEHPAVFTIDEMLALHLEGAEAVAKNLFLRDDKKRSYYLVTVREETHLDLKQFQADHHTRRLSFASEEDLKKILGLEKGSVTPFGLLNDASHQVKFFLDGSFRDQMIGIHPNENTATVWLNANDLMSLLKESGAECEYC